MSWLSAGTVSPGRSSPRTGLAVVTLVGARAVDLHAQLDDLFELAEAVSRATVTNNMSVLNISLRTACVFVLGGVQSRCE
jgi:hypothetical protein